MMESKKSLTEQELYNIGSSLCARSEHCSAEVHSRLRKGTDDEAVIAKVIARLCKEKFIDERRYSHAFIMDKLRFDKWGRNKIRQELWKKHIAESIYEPLLSEIDEKQYVNTLCELLKAKRKSVKGKNEYEIKVKLFRFAASRGFEPNYIYSALQFDDEVMNDLVEGDDNF